LVTRSWDDADFHRCDLGIAFHSGSRPTFFNNPSFRDSLTYPDLTLLLKLTEPVATFSQYSPARAFYDINEELTRAWIVISDFCSVINFAVESEQRISTETLLDTMSSVMYRLLDMSFEANSSDEAIRLGLLAFSSGIFLKMETPGHVLFSLRFYVQRLPYQEGILSPFITALALALDGWSCGGI
jgi:hypothetical protein